MLLGFDRFDYTASLVGTGAEFVGDGTPDKLKDGSPQSVARLGWLSAGSPVITDYVEIQCSVATGKVPRVACLIAPSTSTATALPIGLKVSVVGRLVSGGGYTAPLGGNSTSQRTRRLPGGGVGCFWVFDAGLGACNGFALRIYNDVAGATVFTASTDLDLGELAVMRGVDVTHKAGWGGDPEDPTITRRTLTSQLNVVERTPWRRFTCDIAMQETAAVRGGGLDGSMDWLQLTDFLTRKQQCIAIPRWRDSTGTLDTDEINRTAVYGVASKVPGATHLAGPWSEWGAMEFEEVPA